METVKFEYVLDKMLSHECEIQKTHGKMQNHCLEGSRLDFGFLMTFDKK